MDRRYSPTFSWHSMTTTADSLPPFAKWTAFPSSDYYGGSAPSRVHQPTTGLPCAALAVRSTGRSRNGSHVHCVSIDGGGAQLFSDSISAGTPQTFPAASDGAIRDHRRSRLAVNKVGARCIPTQIRQVRVGFTITEVQPLVHLRYTFPSCSPNPDRLAVPARPGFVRAASHPPRRLPDQAALSFTRSATTAGRRSSLTSARTHSASWRTRTT